VTATRKAVSVRAARGRLWLAQHDGLRAFDGWIEVRRRAGGLSAINVVGLQSYLAAVVPREMPALWPMDALRAQAVAARTYAARVKRYARSNGSTYDICATTACQVYGGAAWRARPTGSVTPLTHPRTTRAARDTAGRVLVWRGEPILAQYSSSTGGWSDSGGVPYLRAVRDRADRVSPYHHWRTRVSASHIESHWPSIGRLRAVRITRRNGHGAWGGRARRVAIVGTRRTAYASGDGFQAAMGLRSDWFRVARTVRARAGIFTVDLGSGDEHPDVRRLQQRLRRAGVYPRSAPITTYFGSITLRAVRRYQRAHDISATGYVGSITRARLNHRTYRFKSGIGYGTRSPVVRELQHRLRHEGFYPRSAPRTSYFGSITRRAVKRYQRAHDIRATGYLGPATRRSLNR
jgi:SpoIID/LytB domain protein